MPERLNLAEQTGPHADRRRYPRLAIRTLAYVDLDGGNGGLILNISEDGLAVQAAQVLVESAFPEMRFRLTGSDTWIQTAGKVIWQGASRKEAGIQFVNLSEENRRLIREWISSQLDSSAVPGEPTAGATAENAGSKAVTTSSLPEFGAMFPSESTLPPSRAHETPETPRRAADRRGARPKASPTSSATAEQAKSAGDRATKGRFDGPSLVDPSSKSPNAAERAVPSTTEAEEAHQKSDNQPAAMMPLEALRRATTARPELAGGKKDAGRIVGRPPDMPVPKPLPRALPSDIPTSGSWKLTPEYEDAADSELLPRKRPYALIALCLAAALGLIMFILGPPNLQNLIFGTGQPPAGAPTDSTQPQAISPSTAGPPSGPVRPGATDEAGPPAPQSSAAGEQPLGPPVTDRGGTLPAVSPENGVNPAKALHEPEKARAGRPDALANHRQSIAPGAPVHSRGFSQSETEASAYARQRSGIPNTQNATSPRLPSRQTPQLQGADQNRAGLPSVPIAPRNPRAGTVAISSHFNSVRGAPARDSNDDLDSPSGKLQIGQLASFRQPAYPPEAAQRRIQGTVRLRAVVAQNGVVESVKLLSGPPGLTASAIDAVRDWRYEQTLLDGHPVESIEDIAVEFRLANSTPSPR
jgi:TonB family protein